jgi:hypothetical protein
MIADHNLLEVAEKLLKWKQLYHDIKDQGLKQGSVGQRSELFSTLGISDFHRPSLTTLILMPDASNSVLFQKQKPKSSELAVNEFCDYLVREHRHRDIGCLFMFGCQKIIDLPTDIRANSDSIVILNGYPRREIAIIRHINCDITLDEFWDLCSELEGYNNIIADKHKNKLIIEL